MAADLSPREKAAVLMVALGKESSAQLYKHLSEDEIEQLTLSITALDMFDTDVRNEVLDEFYEILLAQKYLSEGGIDYARDILMDAVGEEKAEELIRKLSASLQVRPFDFVRRADPAQLINFIQNEHPQTIALILSYMEPDKASSILSSLDENIQANVVKRIANMNAVSLEYIKEAERILEHKLSSVGQEENAAVGGVDTIVEMLNAIDRATEKNIMEQIETDDPDLADEIKRKMFVFEDIVKLSDRDMQRVLREVENDKLTMALKGTNEDDAVSQKIFANISARLHDTILENMEYMGPVRVRDVEEAQQQIVNIIRRLEDAGEIEIARGGESDALVV